MCAKDAFLKGLSMELKLSVNGKWLTVVHTSSEKGYEDDGL
jgi:hypothetical protein